MSSGRLFQGGLFEGQSLIEGAGNGCFTEDELVSGTIIGPYSGQFFPISASGNPARVPLQFLHHLMAAAPNGGELGGSPNVDIPSLVNNPPPTVRSLCSHAQHGHMHGQSLAPRQCALVAHAQLITPQLKPHN